MADPSSQPGRKKERSGQILSLLRCRKKNKINTPVGTTFARQCSMLLIHKDMYVCWSERNLLLCWQTLSVYVQKAVKMLPDERAPEFTECEFMRVFYVRDRAYASLCLPVCLCVREREGEQNGLRGMLCFNWWHVARWKSTLQIPVLTGACSCPEDTQSTQAPRTSCVQTFLTL